jgi:hypothetical protein
MGKELDDEVGKFGGMGLQRCKRIKKNGDRCKNAPMKGQTVCHKHGGKAPQNLRKAAERLAAAAPGAAKRVEHLSEHAKSETVRLQANQDILNRAGIGKRELEVTVTTQPWQEMLGEVFLEYDAGDDEPITLSPDDNGAYVPDERNARWEGMPRRQPTGDPRPADPPPPRRRRPDFWEPNAPGYASP